LFLVLLVWYRVAADRYEADKLKQKEQKEQIEKLKLNLVSFRGVLSTFRVVDDCALWL
jgi:hypothetical protein